MDLQFVLGIALIGAVIALFWIVGYEVIAHRYNQSDFIPAIRKQRRFVWLTAGIGWLALVGLAVLVELTRGEPAPPTYDFGIENGALFYTGEGERWYLVDHDDVLWTCETDDEPASSVDEPRWDCSQ